MYELEFDSLIDGLCGQTVRDLAPNLIQHTIASHAQRLARRGHQGAVLINALEGFTLWRMPDGKQMVVEDKGGP